MPKIRRSQLVDAARELNEVLGLDPKIDETKNTTKLKELIREAFKLTDPMDSFSESTWEVGDLLEIKNPNQRDGKEDEVDDEDDNIEEKEDDDDEEEDDDDEEDDEQEEEDDNIEEEDDNIKEEDDEQEEEDDDDDEGFKTKRTSKQISKTKKSSTRKELTKSESIKEKKSSKRYTNQQALYDAFKDGGGTKKELVEKVYKLQKERSNKDSLSGARAVVQINVSVLELFGAVIKDGDKYYLASKSNKKGK